MLSLRSRLMSWCFPSLRRPSFSVWGRLWEQANQQPIRGIQLDAKIVNPPYLHHIRINTTFVAFPFGHHRPPPLAPQSPGG